MHNRENPERDRADVPADPAEADQGPFLVQAPAWRVAIPFVLFCLIVFGTWCFSRNPGALVAIALAAAMGTVWT